MVKINYLNVFSNLNVLWFYEWAWWGWVGGWNWWPWRTFSTLIVLWLENTSPWGDQLLPTLVILAFPLANLLLILHSRSGIPMSRRQIFLSLRRAGGEKKKKIRRKQRNFPWFEFKGNISVSHTLRGFSARSFWEHSILSPSPALGAAGFIHGL